MSRNFCYGFIGIFSFVDGDQTREVFEERTFSTCKATAERLVKEIAESLKFIKLERLAKVKVEEVEHFPWEDE